MIRNIINYGTMGMLKDIKNCIDKFIGLWYNEIVLSIGNRKVCDYNGFYREFKKFKKIRF